jgi:hypothetical protein
MFEINISQSEINYLYPADLQICRHLHRIQGQGHLKIGWLIGFIVSSPNNRIKRTWESGGRGSYLILSSKITAKHKKQCKMAEQVGTLICSDQDSNLQPFEYESRNPVFNHLSYWGRPSSQSYRLPTILFNFFFF